MIINPHLIENLDYPSKEKFKKQYGQIEADMFFIVTPKPGVKFMNITQIFDTYKVDKSCRNYPVYIDPLETTEPKTLLADTGSIKTVAVNKEKKYIYIKTIFYENTIKFRKEAAESQRELLKKAMGH